jgi:hypothetical protein
MERPPGPSVFSKVFDQIREIWMLKLRGGGKIIKFGKGFIGCMNDSPQHGIIFPVCDGRINVP